MNKSAIQPHPSSLSLANPSPNPRTSLPPLTPAAQRLRHLAEATIDLPTRCRYIVRYLGPLYDKVVYGLSPQALAIISRCPGSDNLHQLENLLARAVQNCQGSVILPEHLSGLTAESSLHGTMPPSPKVGARGAVHKSASPRVHRWEELAPPVHPIASSPPVHLPPHPDTPPTIRPLREALEELERQLITQALEAANHDLSHAAELLVIPRQTLQYRMKALGIPPKAE